MVILLSDMVSFLGRRAALSGQAEAGVPPGGSWGVQPPQHWPIFVYCFCTAECKPSCFFEGMRGSFLTLNSGPG